MRDNGVGMDGERLASLFLKAPMMGTETPAAFTGSAWPMSCSGSGSISARHSVCPCKARRERSRWYALTFPWLFGEGAAMHSVLLVDDEPFVRLSLASLRQWEEDGFSLRFEASKWPGGSCSS